MPRSIAPVTAILHFLVVCLAATLMATTNARADDYPVRNVTIPVPYAAGGGTDILARLLAQGLSEKFGKSVVVDNRPGGGTVLAANVAAKAAPDGYTLLMGTSTPKATFDKLHAALKEIEALPATKQKITSFGMIPATSGSVTELRAFVKSEIGRWGEVVKKSGAAIN